MQLRFALCVLCTAALAVGACDGRRLGLQQLNVFGDPPIPISEEEIAAIDWGTPEEFRITLIEFGIFPEDPTLTLGKPYRLEIRNFGDESTSIAAKDFFEGAVIRDVQVEFVELHGSTPHEEKPIAQLEEYPTGLDSDPVTMRLNKENAAASDEVKTDESGEAKPESMTESAMEGSKESDSEGTANSAAAAEAGGAAAATADSVRVELISLPPSHAAYLTLVPLRAGHFPFIGRLVNGQFVQITVEDPAAVTDDTAEQKDAES